MRTITMYKQPEEPRVSCAQCAGQTPIGDALYDEFAEHYVCGDACLDDWADDNYYVVVASYKRHNIYGI